MPPNYIAFKKHVQAQTQNMVSTLPHDTCLSKKFSIVFYVVVDSVLPYVGVPNWSITPAQITTAVDSLNGRFKRICVSFENCSTAIIKKFEYNQFSQNPHEAQIIANHYTHRTINIYLVDNIVNGPGGGAAGGYTYMPDTIVNNKKNHIIFIRKQSLSNTKLLYHIMGHFFGLPDTYAEISNPNMAGPSQELVARTNCYTNGDGFCDTEADCYPTGAQVPSPCGFIYGPQDAQNKYYTPPVDNFMTEWTPACRCQYTQEQYNFMAKVMLTVKRYLH